MVLRTTERVLELLEQHRGRAVSGEELAGKLGVSRNAVWKAIEELRRGGVKIYAKTKKGYFLPESDMSLSKEGITALLGKTPLTIDVRGTVTSTNDLLKQLALNGAPEGYALIAREQTAGKGAGYIYPSCFAQGLGLRIRSLSLPRRQSLYAGR